MFSKIISNKLLILIIFLTFIKGLFWTGIVPLFQVPDEHHHYATIQHYAEPKDYKPLSNDFPIGHIIFNDTRTQNLSPELKAFLKATQFDEIRFNPESKLTPIDNNISENKLRENKLSHFVEKYPAWYIKKASIYYNIASIGEKIFYNFSIMERAYIARIFSIILTTLTILFSYFIFRKLYFNKLESSLSAGIISFHPMFSFMSSSINLDSMLFLSFTIFTLGIISALKDKLNKKNALLIIFGIFLAINTKQPGYFLFLPLIISVLFYIAIYRLDKIKKLSKLQKIALLSTLLPLILSLLYFTLIKFFSLFDRTNSVFNLDKYIEYHLQFSLFIDRSLSYWGNFGWLNIPISTNIIFIIWIFLFLATLGITLFIVDKIRKWKKLNINDKILFFQVLTLLIITVGLNLLIHFVNFQQSNINDLGNPLKSIGTQGRYFLPAIVSKFAILIIGISYLFKKFKREKIIFVIFFMMIILNTISLFNYVIPRFYL